MMRLLLPMLRLLAALVLLAGAGAVRADTPMALWKAFDGRLSFTGTQVTLRNRANSVNACSVEAPTTTRTARLTLPANASVVSARLYWAGSGTPDNTVTFEGKDTTAVNKYSSTTIGNGYNYFGGVADVTSVVKAKGSGTYSFAGLTVSTGSPWCNSQAVLGGFALLVVYSDASLPQRVLNVYEGFRYVQNDTVTLSANNFRWNRTGVSTKETARAGYISWEGDPTLAQDERFQFDGEDMGDSLNPADNLFNSQSNVNGDSASYGVDFDAFDTSVTLWSGYDAVVDTAFRSGSDMVILNAEILAIPTLPVSDLSIAISRAGALKIGTDVEYTVTVSNNGPYTEAGTITVTNTLPPGMYYVAGTTTGWTCSASTTAGTCTYKGGLAPGASAPPLIVYARVTSAGEKTNTVKVQGTASDDNLANNSASDTGTATNADGSTTPPSTPSVYIFTDSVCKSGVAIGAAGQCKLYSAATVGGKPTPIYLTATKNDLPATPNASADTTVAMEFMLECSNPAAGTREATYTGTAVATIPKCAGTGQVSNWSAAVNVTFSKVTISVAQSLVYNDVGKIRLNLRVGASQSKTEIFVSAPARIGFRRIAYTIGAKSYDNPGVKLPAGTGFAPAGATLTVETGALLYDGTSFAPNFGNEFNPQPVVVLRPAPTSGVVLAAPGALKVTARPAWGNGVSTLEANFSEVGSVDFVAGLADPANPDNQDAKKLYNLYFGVAVGESTVTVGRFHPAYFRTEAIGPFDCPPNLPAAYACLHTDKGAVYSRQPFGVTVTAYNQANEPVDNFSGGWFKTITLSAAGDLGGAELPTRLTAPGASASTTIASAGAGGIAASTSFQLALGYDDSKWSATNMTAPTTIFVRAVSEDTTLAGKMLITSQRGGEASDEGDIMVLNGRVKLPNAIGVDLLQTALGMRAEYWAGAYGWLLNRRYADSRAVAAADIASRECTYDFVDASGCIGSLIGPPATPKDAVFKEGGGPLWLRAPGKKAGGAARRGAFSIRYNGIGWLPSTTGRVNFGIARSPLIYVREMYF